MFVGTTVTFSLYMLSNSWLSVAAVPVMPQSFGNCHNSILVSRERNRLNTEQRKEKEEVVHQAHWDILISLVLTSIRKNSQQWLAVQESRNGIMNEFVGE